MNAVISKAKGQVNSERATMLGMGARGVALAENYLEAIQNEGNTLRRHLIDVAGMDQTGRSAFRKALTEWLANMRKAVKEANKKDMPVMKGSFASAAVRVSEAVTFSKAIDAGWSNFKKVSETLGYHAMIGEARKILASGATGPTRRQGRKAATPVEKAINYLAKLGLKVADLRKIDEAVETMIENGGKLPAEANPATPKRRAGDKQETVAKKAAAVKRTPKAKQEPAGATA